MQPEPLLLNGVKIFKEFLSRSDQTVMVEALRDVARSAPFRRYETPGGRRMSVRMTGAGSCAWVSDSKGYRYDATQPDGTAWPDIPDCMLNVWETVGGVSGCPDSCLINFYDSDARMGLHQDHDEADLAWPVVSISLGDEALFRVGGLSRDAPTKSIWLQSGDVAVLSGAARLAYHGIDRVKLGSSALLPNGGRINVTLRVAKAPIS